MLKEELTEMIIRARASGHAVTVDPPMPRAAIADLEARCGAALPTEIRELVEYAQGFSVDSFSVRFGGEEPFEFEGAFPHSIPISHDGGGNFWVVDIAADGQWGAVFFVTHDPPVVVLSASDLGSFIAQAFDTPATAHFENQLVAKIWKRNPYVISREQALASADPVLRAFARELTEDYVIADLRDSVRGKGFVWGIAGPDTDVRRAGSELLFATEKRKRGMLARLFSR